MMRIIEGNKVFITKIYFILLFETMIHQGKKNNYYYLKYIYAYSAEQPNDETFSMRLILLLGLS